MTFDEIKTFQDKIPPLPWTESEPIVRDPTQKFRAGTPAISARDVCVSAIFANFYCDNWIIAPLSSSLSSSSSLSDPTTPHQRLERDEMRAHATRTWLIIPFWSTGVLTTMSNYKMSVFVICKMSVFVGLKNINWTLPGAPPRPSQWSVCARPVKHHFWHCLFRDNF